MRLYEFVFNNNSENEMKRINFKQEQARTAKPLCKALQISDGRPMLQAAKRSTHEMTTDDEGSIMHDNNSSHQVKVQENEIEQQADDSEGEAEEAHQDEAADKVEEEDEEYAKLDETIKQSKMSREHKMMLNDSIVSWDQKMNSLIEKRNQELDLKKK